MDCLLDPFLQQHIVFSISSNKKFAQWPHSHIPRGLNPRSRGENTRHGYYESLRLGSSPLTRGKRDWDPTDPRHPRLIPAHAGKTTTVVGGVLSVAAHPRSRGENAPSNVPSSSYSGSSPLTRGNPAQVLQIEVGPRLIPAHAGKTRCLLRRLSRARAHPRSRGENDRDDINGATASGSSPLTRGKQALLVGQQDVAGLIPAHAGKTARVFYPRRCGPAHPRSRGENVTS